jgi:transcriptional regulator with XRE-family HTH domain
VASSGASPVENLVEFIKLRRARIGLGHNALARASGIDPGSLANLMVGRVKRAPTLATLQKLAVGLQVDADVLIRIASGMSVNLKASSEAAFAPEAKARPRSESVEGVEGRFPLTKDEAQVLQAIATIGIQWKVEEHPEVLDIAPADRKWIFRDLESVLHTLEMHRKLQGTWTPGQLGT